LSLIVSTEYVGEIGDVGEVGGETNSEGIDVLETKGMDNSGDTNGGRDGMSCEARGLVSWSSAWMGELEENVKKRWRSRTENRREDLFDDRGGEKALAVDFASIMTPKSSTDGEVSEFPREGRDEDCGVRVTSDPCSDGAEVNSVLE
jgi:hypothetical protein